MSLMRREIPGYRQLRIGAAEATCRDDSLALVQNAIEVAGTLYHYAARHPQAQSIQGRTPVYLIPGPASARWVVRKLSHGGTLAPLTRDRFLRLGTPRPLNELHVALKLRELGIPTPTVAAALVYYSGLLYRGEVARHEITDARDLAALLFDSETLSSTERIEAIAAAGFLIGSLHRAGVVHPDLNLRNVLLRRASGTWAAYILDVEKCRTVPTLRPRQREGMLGRLRRSARRFEARTGTQIAAREWQAFNEAYGAGLVGDGKAAAFPPV